MTSEDDAFLKSLNAKKPATAQCSEDHFEEAMDFFERISHEKQPFAAVDNTPVLPYEEMESSFDETVSDPARKYAKDVYDHWKQQRLKRGNRDLMPSLKFETNLDTDDADPYVCFRRREVRQARKTRGRDAQVTEKLKKLRHELEEARNLMNLVKQREALRREELANDRLIFEKRMEVKEVKRNLGIKGEDEDLINQKPAPKPKPKLDASAIQRGVPGMVSKPQLSRVDGRPLDNDLITLEEQIAKREDEITRSIEINKEKHREWNKHYVDVTWRAITPPLEENIQPAFRTAITQYLPTPPASISSEVSGDNANSGNMEPKHGDNALVRYATPPQETFQGRPSFRRRTGRGGRLMIDRRGLKRPATDDINDRAAERYKYDQDSDEEDCTIPIDFYADAAIKYRIIMDRAVSREAAAHAAQAAHAQQAAAARRSIGAAGMQSGQSAQMAHPIQQQQRIANGPS
ncbi:uncharacterized protein K452DRAFT_286584 [Aplosporella prunicola CBS 121167]|uniref:Enhancer of polycomb-like protein n=1 Tax=Aplosporella prunicola CBS 121167 TaxID=1176127 RepID=A0A6A6BFK6_9PEZI|nr:uncharacterized protein K452DRAFT_286584 [Aplosporella prunicola CBS 121167]KAF2142949.1 hypothetical protein K452DRAFT_286584 [Aplosporella prunicola CBS 121167]